MQTFWIIVGLVVFVLFLVYLSRRSKAKRAAVAPPVNFGGGGRNTGGREPPKQSQ